MSQSVFSKFSPKTNFFLGLAGGIVALLVVGFFIMLGLFLSDDKPTKVAGTNNNGNQPIAQAPSGDRAPAPSVDVEVTKADHILGDFDAPVTIVEFSDFECPFCSRHHPTLTRIIEEYDGQVRWVYKHFPLSSIHTQAQSAAEASECAADQGGNDAFWAFGEGLFENQPRLGRDLYVELAGNLGLNGGDFESCIDSGKFRQKVQADYQQGIAAGVQGTPGNLINGQLIPGAVPYEQIKSIVDGLL